MKKIIFLLSLSLLFSQFLSFSVLPVFAAQTYDISSPSSYNLRFDGEKASDYLSRWGLTVADLNNNGKNDIIVNAYFADHGTRTNCGAVYVINDSLLDDYTGTSNNIDLANSANYNLKFYGAMVNDTLGYTKAEVVDLDNDGRNDLVIGATGADFNSRSSSGSLYVIYDELIDDYSGTGNNIDLNISSNYNLRYDGAKASSILAITFKTGDINNNGKNDIVVSARGETNNLRTSAGSLYVINDSLIDDYTGTGNNIDLLVSANYNLRYDGALASDWFGDDSLVIADLNSNGKKDILTGSAFLDNPSRTDSGSLYIIYDSLIDGYSGTGKNIDMAIASNYNLRYDGAVTGDNLTYGFSVQVADMDNNGKPDLLVSALSANYNSRTNSGSLYLIYDSLVDDYSGTGNNIDLATASNYNVRYDGAQAQELFTDLGFFLTDFDGDNRQDIVAGACQLQITGEKGVVYVIYNTLVDDYSGTGNNVDMANSNNYSLKYDGTGGSHLNTSDVSLADLNGDGSNDWVLPAHYSSFNSRTKSGSFYVIYNFPHSFSLDSVEEYSRNTKPKITGNILAPNSVLNPYNVQFQVDASAFYGTWSECPADDGSYDTKDVAEKFTCQLTTALSEGIHKVYIRASDANGSYSARHSAAFLNTDLTGPTVALTQIGSQKLKTTTQTDLTSLISSTQPTFYGKITDSLSQSLASGPREVAISLQKKTSSNAYQPQETRTLTLTQNYWEADNTKITDNTKNTSNKYSTFSYTPNQKLVGTYQLIFIGKDKADNQGSSKTFQFTVGGGEGIANEITVEPTQPEEIPISQPQPTPISQRISVPKSLSFFQRILNFLKTSLRTSGRFKEALTI